MSDPSSSEPCAKLAFERWLAALRAFGELAPVRAAFAPEARVERHGWDASRGHVMETFTGHTQIAAWCGRSPRNVQFELCSTPVQKGETISARYSVRVGDYENHGLWRASMAEDGRLGWLSHQPDDLPDEWRDGVPQGKSLGPPSPEAVTAAAHDHKHDNQPGSK